MTALADLEILENKDEIEAFAEEIGLNSMLKNRFVKAMSQIKLNDVAQQQPQQKQSEFISDDEDIDQVLLYTDTFARMSMHHIFRLVDKCNNKMI